MGLIFFSKNFWSINSRIIIIIVHGICSSGIFSSANMIYERSHSRLIIIFIIFISFFSASYRLILYSNLQQGCNNNLIFNIDKINFRENITLLSHIWLLLLLLLSPILL